MKGKSDRGTRM